MKTISPHGTRPLRCDLGGRTSVTPSRSTQNVYQLRIFSAGGINRTQIPIEDFSNEKSESHAS